MSPEESLARQLCARAGNIDPDALVYRMQPVQVHTPEGMAYGGIVSDLRPLWMMWLNEALSIRHVAREMMEERAK